VKQTPSQLLKQFWGFDSFRGSQEHIIQSVLEGNDVLALLPTGGGKSLCYQIPALAQDGICIVVSPLIALIKDQVNQLKIKGIKAVALTGGLSFEETSTLLDNCLYGSYSFLYLSPEKLQQEMVQDRIGNMNVNLVAIDEAHCISQWGNDFRPAYLKCSILREQHPKVPIIALTATATKRVSKDIQTNLNLKSPTIYKDSFSRSNLTYKVIYEEDKKYRLKQLCKKGTKSGIVYVRSRRMAEELSQFLNSNSIRSSYFHGGITTREKEKKLQEWLDNKIRFVVATNAFGMGIDKPDVALVVHYQIPDSIENYFQEAGRAGRDGNPADAVLITNASDEIRVKNQFINVLPDIPFIKTLYNKLNNYFQIPYGTAEESTFPFRFNHFCDTYSFNPILTYNGLRFLDQNSVIALSQNFSRRTTVRFLASKSAIFKYLEEHPKIASILQVLLRTYGGVFEYDTKINTLLISKKANVNEEMVLSALEKTEMDGIISYSAEHRDMELTFLVPREDDLTINFISKKIRTINQIKIDNVNAMLAYIKNRKQCRNQQLLAYFGEKKKDTCGKCDVCQDQSNIDTAELKTIEKEILTLLGQKEYTSRKITTMLPYHKDVVLKVLQFLLEDGNIEINTKNEYSLI